MKNKTVPLLMCFSLCGCVGSFVTGQTELLDEDYPDITTVPCRQEASQDWGVHAQPEKKAREVDLKDLEKDRDRAKKEAAELRRQYLQ